jgi:hypothetical protein
MSLCPKAGNRGFTAQARLAYGERLSRKRNEIAVQAQNIK